MADQSLIYRIPGAAWSLRFSRDAVRHLTSHAQRRCWSKEKVGQLYSADLSADVVEISAVSTLGSKWSSYAGVRLDMAAVIEERERLFDKGLHCLGFWHTHPEPVPKPSPDDVALAKDHAKAGKDVFAGLVFVIVGTDPPPTGLGVWVHDGATLWQATPL